MGKSALASTSPSCDPHKFHVARSTSSSSSASSSHHRPHHRHRHRHHHHRRHERRVNIVLIPTPRRTVATCVRSPWRTMAPFQQYIDTHAPCDRSSVRSHAKSCVYHVVSAHNTSVLMHTNTGHRRTSYRTVAPSVSAQNLIRTHSHPPHPLSLVAVFARTVNTCIRGAFQVFVCPRAIALRSLMAPPGSFLHIPLSPRQNRWWRKTRKAGKWATRARRRRRQRREERRRMDREQRRRQKHLGQAHQPNLRTGPL